MYSGLLGAWQRSMQEVKGSPRVCSITSPCPLRLPVCWHLPVTMGMFSPLLAGDPFPPLSGSPSHHAETQEIPGCRGPTKSNRTAFIPGDKVQIIIGFISAGDVDLSKWAYSPSSCLSDISPAAAPPWHPHRLSSLPPSSRLSALLFLLLPDSGRFRSFRCLCP